MTEIEAVATREHRASVGPLHDNDVLGFEPPNERGGVRCYDELRPC